MKRNFCRTCELEFQFIFRQEFKTINPIADNFNSYNCSRNYLDNDDIVKSCLRRLTESLYKYTNNVSFHSKREKLLP